MNLTAVQQGLPIGYKQTILGPLPCEWDAVPLGELFVFKNGLNKAKRFFGTGIPIVNYMDVFEHPGLRSGHLTGRVDLRPEEIRNFSVRQGDVFFTRTSETVEEIGVASVMLDEPCDTVFSGFVLRARPRTGRLDHGYKQYCFAPKIVRSQIVSKATFTTRALTNGRALSAVWIAIPPEPEQRAIAKVLSDVDGLIGALDALIAKKRAIKLATMQQLLSGETRLPGFSGAWETKRVSEFGDIVTGETPSIRITAFWDGSYPWITPTDITSDRDMTVSERMITREGLNSIRRTLPPNTVLVTCIASIGKNAILRKTGSCNQQINAVIPNSVHDAEFLYYLFEHNSRFLLAKAGITATPIISKSIFSNFVFRVPSLKEQRSIALILSDIDAEITALEQRRDKTRAIRQGMMQQLLTGRVRLVKSDVRPQSD